MIIMQSQYKYYNLFMYPNGLTIWRKPINVFCNDA